MEAEHFINELKQLVPFRSTAETLPKRPLTLPDVFSKYAELRKLCDKLIKHQIKKHKREYNELRRKYVELGDEYDDIGCEYFKLNEKHDKLVVDNQKLIEKHNALCDKYNDLVQEYKKMADKQPVTWIVSSQDLFNVHKSFQRFLSKYPEMAHRSGNGFVENAFSIGIGAIIHYLYAKYGLAMYIDNAFWIKRILPPFPSPDVYPVYNDHTFYTNKQNVVVVTRDILESRPAGAYWGPAPHLLRVQIVHSETIIGELTVPTNIVRTEDLDSYISLQITDLHCIPDEIAPFILSECLPTLNNGIVLRDLFVGIKIKTS
jgi:hypothetical protein